MRVSPISNLACLANFVESPVAVFPREEFILKTEQKLLQLASTSKKKWLLTQLTPFKVALGISSLSFIGVTIVFIQLSKPITKLNLLEHELNSIENEITSDTEISWMTNPEFSIGN